MEWLIVSVVFPQNITLKGWCHTEEKQLKCVFYFYIYTYRSCVISFQMSFLVIFFQTNILDFLFLYHGGSFITDVRMYIYKVKYSD